MSSASLSVGSLHSLLKQRRVLTPGDSSAIVRQLLEQVQALHAAGRIHRAIGAETVSVDAAGRVMLGPPPAMVLLGGDAESLPELGRTAPRELPADLAAARQVLAAAGVAVDPRRIDVYQLGALLCRMLTGQSAGAYLRSPTVRGGARPAAAVLERAFGHDASEALPTRPPSPRRWQKPSDRRAAPPSTPLRPRPPPLDAPARTEPATELPFQRLGHYQVLRRIGHGGMGDVFLGFEEALQRQVALKVLPAELARHDNLVRRFQAEAAAVAQLSHPHVVPLHFFGKDGPHYFFAMQYVEGESLDRLLARRGRLDVADVMSLLEQCLAGLGAAHRAGLIHRDVKPGNILLDSKTGRAMVADFGLVKTGRAV